MVDDIGVWFIYLALREELQCNDTQIESLRHSRIFKSAFLLTWQPAADDGVHRICLDVQS
jgi:hypothetical protein